MINGFDEFWSLYPRKVGRGQARRAYAKALKLAPHDDIMFGLSQQIESMLLKERQFIPHGSTWLNGERWDDEIETSATDAQSNIISLAARLRRSPGANRG